MKYWEDFHDKFGFGDGDCMPPDAVACRTVYIREINKLAARLGSAYRVFAWDRSGVHNPYYILTCPAARTRRVKRTLLLSGTWDPDMGMYWTGEESDTQLDDAIEQAHGMHLDDRIDCVVNIRYQK